MENQDLAYIARQLKLALQSRMIKDALRSFGANASPASILDIQKSDLLLVIKTDAYETHPVIGFEINMGVKNRDIKLNIISDKRGKLSKLPGAKTLVHTPGSEVAVLNAIAKSILDEKLTDGSAVSLSLIHISEPTRPY